MALSAYVSGIMMAGSNYVLPFMVTCLTYVCSASLYYVFFYKVEKESAKLPLARVVIPAKK
jgi:hypothetical protein